MALFIKYYSTAWPSAKNANRNVSRFDDRAENGRAGNMGTDAGRLSTRRQPTGHFNHLHSLDQSAHPIPTRHRDNPSTQTIETISSETNQSRRRLLRRDCSPINRYRPEQCRGAIPYILLYQLRACSVTIHCPHIHISHNIVHICNVCHTQCTGHAFNCNRTCT